jgi:hypothetical protein
LGEERDEDDANRKTKIKTKRRNDEQVTREKRVRKSKKEQKETIKTNNIKQRRENTRCRRGKERRIRR